MQYNKACNLYKVYQTKFTPSYIHITQEEASSQRRCDQTGSSQVSTTLSEHSYDQRESPLIAVNKKLIGRI